MIHHLGTRSRYASLQSPLVGADRWAERAMPAATIPDDDLIEHEPEDCICGPTLQLVRDGDVYAWVLVHHRLDGR